MAKSDTVYQFKISLKGSKPKVWRRIQVPKDYNFYQLHRAIVCAMGWQDYHLHQFEVTIPGTNRKQRVADPNDYEESSLKDNVTSIADFFISPNTKAHYEYDFGDSWEHELLFEKEVAALAGTDYPKCLDGKMACPPEDCGGVYGYMELLGKISTLMT
uniref:Plasmid pRiA4b Orf3-like domain-containing protein n=1 Tax=Ditylenchus dipsaci TaxID=166011 RepID=A0A915E8F3_9BILA